MAGNAQTPDLEIPPKEIDDAGAPTSPPVIINDAIGNNLGLTARILDRLFNAGWHFVRPSSLTTPLSDQLFGLAREEAVRLIGIDFGLPEDGETAREAAYVTGIDEAVRAILRLAAPTPTPADDGARLRDLRRAKKDADAALNLYRAGGSYTAMAGAAAHFEELCVAYVNECLLTAAPAQAPAAGGGVGDEETGWRDMRVLVPKENAHILLSVDGETRIGCWGKTSHVPIYGWILTDQGAENCDLCEPDGWMPLPKAIAKRSPGAPS